MFSEVGLPENKYKAMVRCFTYNHSEYIEKALSGFIMQKTTFPYVCYVVDDASTDGEQDVIKAFLDKECDLSKAAIWDIDEANVIIVPPRSNPNCTLAIYLLKINLYRTDKKRQLTASWRSHCEYEAFCEGDDYWIDPLKLQKQVDFLDAHPQHSLCIHAYNRFNVASGKVDPVHKYSQDVETIPIEDVFNTKGMFGATASMVYRLSALDDYPDWARRAPIGDRTLKMVLYHRGSFGYINDIMSVYNIGTKGSWTQRVYKNRSLDKKRDYFRRMNQIYYDYDEWTGGKYHDILMRCVRQSKFHQGSILLKTCVKNLLNK